MGYLPFHQLRLPCGGTVAPQLWKSRSVGTGVLWFPPGGLNGWRKRRPAHATRFGNAVLRSSRQDNPTDGGRPCRMGVELHPAQEGTYSDSAIRRQAGRRFPPANTGRWKQGMPVPQRPCLRLTAGGKPAFRRMGKGVQRGKDGGFRRGGYNEGQQDYTGHTLRVGDTLLAFLCPRLGTAARAHLARCRRWFLPEQREEQDGKLPAISSYPWWSCCRPSQRLWAAAITEPPPMPGNKVKPVGFGREGPRTGKAGVGADAERTRRVLTPASSVFSISSSAPLPEQRGRQ